MPTFNTQVIRIAADTTSKDNILDLNTSAEPEAWWARDLTIQVGVFAGGALLNVGDLQSVSLYLKDPSNLDGAPLVTKTITAFDNTTTLTSWQAGAQQHFVVTFSADDLSFSLTNTDNASSAQRLVHLSIVAITTGGQTGTICVGTMNIIDDGGNSPSGNPVNAITVSQAQAMVAALAFSNAVVALSAAGNTAISNAQAWLLGRQPISLAAGSGAYVANLALSDVNALAGALLRIPVDFAASGNPAVNIYDNSTAGTLLEGPLVNPNPAAAASFLFTAAFDGTAWHKESGVWVA
jgi:hypothetical protein